MRPKGTLTFSATGGTGGYTYSIVSNPSGGAISGGGVYTAGSVGSVSDVVRVTDSTANTATATVNVGPAVAIVPASLTLPPHGQNLFTATGGSGGYTFSFVNNVSNGTLAPFGFYQAGLTPLVTDVIKVVDSNGAVAQAAITVGPGISISPANPKTPPKGSLTFTATGGNGGPYFWF